MGANERDQLVHSRRCMGRAALRADYLSTGPRWAKEPPSTTFLDFRIEGSSVLRIWIEVCDCLLYPRNDFGYGSNGLLRQKAVLFVTEPYFYAGVPKPADLQVDFAVVDFLKFDCQIRAFVHGLLRSRTRVVETLSECHVVWRSARNSRRPASLWPR